MSPNDADGMANSVDPYQTAPLGAVWSGSALFAQTCLSENLGKLRYSHLHEFNIAFEVLRSKTFASNLVYLCIEIIMEKLEWKV